MTDAQLLPCPHCGCPDVYVQNAGWKANTFMRCPGCKTTFSVSNGTPGAHEDTVAAWNRRVVLDELDASKARIAEVEGAERAAKIDARLTEREKTIRMGRGGETLRAEGEPD